MPCFGASVSSIKRISIDTALASLRERRTDPDVDQHVLTRAEAHLQLRERIPLCSVPLFKLSNAENLEHRRPRAPPTICHEALAYRDPPERFLCRLLSVGRNFDAGMRAALVVAFVVGRWHRFAKSGFRKPPAEALETQLPVLVA